MRLNLELHPRQGDAYLSKATEMLYGGAAGGGKSHLERAAAIAWAREISGLQVYIFRRTYPELWDNHMTGPTAFPSMLAPLTKIGAAKIVDKDIRFRNGSEIHLRHCQHEKDIYSYQGSEIHVLMIDEAGQWMSSMYKYLRGRVRASKGLNLPDRYRAGCVGLDGTVNGWDIFPRIILTANPGGIMHNYLRQSFVDHGQEIWQAPANDGGMYRQYIPAKLEDNPELEASDYAMRLEGLGSKELVRAMLSGDWDIVSGGAIDDVWDREKHVIKPFKIPASWRINRSFDWGSTKPFSVGWWAESDGTQAEITPGVLKSWPRGTLFRIGEWYGWNGNANEGAKLGDHEIGRGIKEREEKLKEALGISYIAPGPADSAIFDADPGRDSIAQGINQGYSGNKFADIFTHADKAPGSRTRGLEIVRRKLKAALAERMEEPGLFVFETCIDGFVRTVPVLPRDPIKQDDVDSDAEDHTFDETRYRCTEVRQEARVIHFVQ